MPHIKLELSSYSPSGFSSELKSLLKDVDEIYIKKKNETTPLMVIRKEDL